MPTLIAALSAERFDTYLNWTGGDQALAERLYTYNVQLSAALYGPLHMQEIALRNMTDGALIQRYGQTWFDDPAVLTTHYQAVCVAKARQVLQQAGKAVTPSPNSISGSGPRCSAVRRIISGRRCARSSRRRASSAG